MRSVFKGASTRPTGKPMQESSTGRSPGDAEGRARETNNAQVGVRRPSNFRIGFHQWGVTIER